jgi:enamine deaminase RidA (YjgF/YER057c/UK114 family)
MPIRRFSADAASSSDGVIRGDIVTLAGVVAADLSGDVGAQTRDALALIERRLAAAGTDRYQVLTAHIWLRDMQHFRAMTAAWNEWVDPDNPPARTCVSGIAADAPSEASVQIVVSAVVPELAQALTVVRGPASIERYGLIHAPPRPTMCLAIAYRDWFSVCMTAPDVSGDIAAQTRQILNSFDALMADAGTDKSRLLTAEIWIKRIDDFDAMNAVWENWLAPGQAPTRACTRADMSRPECLVEIRVTAAR